MRVTLFTDTLGDVNGVSRFIRNAADAANRTGRDLRVITSTRFATPPWPNIFNFAPVFAAKMPGYPDLETGLPPMGRIFRQAKLDRPDVVHVSTPGPVGLVGLIAARRLRVPVLGVYHTDFPAYIDRLFNDEALTWLTRRVMRAFYKPFRSIFTRSDDYVESLGALGIAREKVLRLMPGVDIGAFSARFRDTSVWGPLGIDAQSVKVLYVGRVSVEKTLPLLTAVWKMVRSRLRASGARRADLVVVGDGPYRVRMQEELAGGDVHFLGFRHGEELSRLYASADLFVFPSVTDTLGQVVMESQASGLPVIVTDQGGPKEVVRHGQTGLVLPVKPVSAWAEAIVSLVSDDGRRAATGRAALASMQEMSIARSFEHFWAVHERVWREHAASRGGAGAPAGQALPHFSKT